MNSVETVLLENIDRSGVLFVFPTDVAASLWADRTLRLHRRPSAAGCTVAMEKFIAWDTFKQNSIRSKVQNRQSVPSVLRKMFVSALIRENAELCDGAGKGNGPPVFSSLIRAEWAGQADSYTGWLTDILPQLGVWFTKSTGLPIAAITGNTVPEASERLSAERLSGENFSGDERDLFCLAQRYAQFLEKHGLFEPAWETPPFDDTGKECFIFFPESLSDFNEYKELLEASANVKTINAGTNETGTRKEDVFFYANSRSEICEAALYILALHKKHNIPWDSISVSIPDRESYGPYLLREFENRNIPYSSRSGKPLGSYPGGQFFTELADCASAGFSFASLTALLLNRHLPWKDSGDIQNLIGFGIKNNCIGSWTEEENGKEKTVNVWDDAFSHPFGGFAVQTRRFFDDLRRRTNALRHADSFSEIRKQYFAFRERFFDMENCLPETDLVLSRCIAELMYLAEIEKSFPDVKVPDPYSFFTGYLKEKIYLAQQSSMGVVILPYRTAAPAPFDCHIVLGASQENLSSVFSPLAFLPGKKREKLGIADNDTSLAFIALHRFNSRLPAAFFCSEQTFSGYAIPHSALGAALKPAQRFGGDRQFAEKFAPDLYGEESRFYASLHFPSGKDEPAAPGEIHKNQELGFAEWRQRRERSSAGDTTKKADHPLMELIHGQYRNCGNEELKGKYSVSPSSLGPYFQCSLKWIFERILRLENVEIETGLMASNIAGQVYHEVLNLFLEDLKKSGEKIARPGDDPSRDSGSDKKNLPDFYRRILAEKVETVFETFPRLPHSEKTEMSMLTARLLRAEKKLFYAKLENFLAAFTSFFAGYRVVASETYYSLPKKSYYLSGIVDCILEDARDGSRQNGSIAIVDFKTKYMPGLAACIGEEGLADFQLPMYLRLAEAALKKEVRAALFYSILDADPQVLFGVIKNAVSGAVLPKKEEDYILRGGEVFNGIMKEFDEKAEQFADEIANGTFSFSPSDPQACLKCDYNKVCRTLYKVYRGNNNGN